MSFYQSTSLLEFFNKISSQTWSLLFVIFPFIAISIFYHQEAYNSKIRPFLISGAVFLLELILFLSWELRHIVTLNFFIIISFIFYIDKKYKKTKNQKMTLNLITCLIVIFCSCHLLYYYRAPLKCQFDSQDMNCNIATTSDKKDSAINYINNKYPSANVATNISPLFYLKTRYLQLSPLNNNLDSLCSKDREAFFAELRTKEINLIAYWPLINSKLIMSFDYKKSKGISNCYYQIEENINALEKNGRIKKIKVLNDVNIYELNKI